MVQLQLFSTSGSENLSLALNYPSFQMVQLSSSARLSVQQLLRCSCMQPQSMAVLTWYFMFLKFLPHHIGCSISSKQKSQPRRLEGEKAAGTLEDQKAGQKYLLCFSISQMKSLKWGPYTKGTKLWDQFRAQEEERIWGSAGGVLTAEVWPRAHAAHLHKESKRFSILLLEDSELHTSWKETEHKN